MTMINKAGSPIRSYLLSKENNFSTDFSFHTCGKITKLNII